MLMAAVAFNIKKLLIFQKNPTKNKAKGVAFDRFIKNEVYDLFSVILSPPKIEIRYL
jgi:hypothetical protein